MAAIKLNNVTTISETGGVATFGTTSATLKYPVGMPIKKSYYAIGRGTYSNVDFPANDTIPQRDEGTEIFSQAYTPSTSSCNLLITTYVRLGESANNSNAMGLGLFISDSDDVLIVGEDYSMGDSNIHSANVTIWYQMSSWGTSEKTFSLRASGGDRFNHFAASSSYVGAAYGTAASKSAMIIEEIAT